MAISVISQPGTFCFAKSPVHYIFNTDNAYSTVGEHSTVTLIFSSFADPGDTMTISYTGKSFTFTFVDSNTTNPLELPTNFTSLSDHAYVYGPLWKKLVQHAELFADIDIVWFNNAGATPKLHFRSRTIGDNDLAIVQGICASNNSSGVNPVPRPNFRIRLEIWEKLGIFAEDGSYEPTTGNTRKIAELEQIPDSLGNATFEVSSVLRQFFGRNYYESPSGRQNNVLARYFIRYAEVYGTPPTLTNPVKVLPDTYAINGGFAIEEAAESETFLENVVMNRWFFSFQPLVKKVRRLSYEVLHVLLNNNTTLQPRVKRYFTDGSTSEANFGSVTPTNYPMLYGVNAYVGAILPGGIETTTKKLYKYEIWFVDPGDPTEPRSVKKTYMVDDEYYENIRYFMFRNSLGGFDTFYTTGKVEQTESTEFSTFRKFIPAEPQQGFSGMGKKINSSIRGMKVNTGYISREWKEYLMSELFKAEEIYEYTETNLFAINIRNTDAKLSDSNDTMHDFTFEYNYAFENTQHQTINSRLLSDLYSY